MNNVMSYEYTDLSYKYCFIVSLGPWHIEALMIHCVIEAEEVKAAHRS